MVKWERTHRAKVTHPHLKLLRTLSLFAMLVLCACLMACRESKPKWDGRKEHSVAQMYDQDDLSTCSLFAGNFINFGLWQDPEAQDRISLSQRIESEKALYRLIATRLELTQEDKVLEIGCGLGVGGVLIMEEFAPREIHGIDFSSAQITRAKQVNRQAFHTLSDKIFFQQGAAENIPYEAHRFEKAFSLEAAQHFDNLDLFTQEVHRVLKPGGRLVLATFFGTSETSHLSLSSTIQTVQEGIDKIVFIDHVKKLLEKSGFKEICIESIGENVWQGFDQWAAQGDLKNSWTRNWYQGYKKGLIDYYLITAEKAK